MRAILACDEEGGIGLNGSLPWPKISEDLQRFRRLTSGERVVMGRGTWEAPDMPHPLPNRLNIVVSSTDIELPESVLHARDIETARVLAKNGWVIGGAKLFVAMLPHITELHLTRVTGIFRCDTHINLHYITNQFRLTHDTPYPDHTYQIWQRL